MAALLSDSLFQGDLLVDEEALLAFDPEDERLSLLPYRNVPPATVRPSRCKRPWNDTLGDYGFATETTAARLAGFLAVQNTYLSAFQSLGAVGLLLGTSAWRPSNSETCWNAGASWPCPGDRLSPANPGSPGDPGKACCSGLGLAVGRLAAAVAVLPQLLHRGARSPGLRWAARWR